MQTLILLLQNESTAETRAAQMGAMLIDPTPEIRRCSVEDLGKYRDALISGSALPVGSVEYMRHAFHIAEVREPHNMSYQKLNDHYLYRQVKSIRVDAIESSAFVKPQQTKSFTGFVYHPAWKVHEYTANDQDELQIFKSLPGETIVWSSEIVSFVGEWRYYIQDNAVLGNARYDPSEIDVLPPSAGYIKELISHLDFPHPYVIDVGILSNGDPAVVELNDAWAIGLYSNSISPKVYFRFLESRWRSIYRAS